MIAIFIKDEHNKELFKTVLDEYVKLWEEDSYGEEYKFEILSDLNEELDKDRIDADSIVDIASTLKKSNPTSGSFAHWSALDDLESVAEKAPEKMSEALNYLVNGSDNLSERISYFREAGKEIDNDVTLGTPLIGYIMAAYDRKQYPIYYDGAMRDFTDLFQIACPGNVSEKYSLYCKFCEQIVDYMLEENLLEEFNVIYGQDFIFLLSQHHDYRFETLLKHIRNKARELRKYRDSTEEFLETIKQMDSDYLSRQRDQYENEEKIKRVRFEILERILSDEEEINKEKIGEIAESVNESYEENILQNWSEFTILFHIYYNFIKDQIKYILNETHDILRVKMEDRLSGENINFKERKAVKGFDWNNYYGTDRCWLALYPEEEDSHSGTAQLFLSISGREIEYGLYIGEKLKEELEGFSDDLEKTSPNNMPRLGDILDKFESVYETYAQINEDGGGELSEPFPEKIRKYFWLTSRPSEIKFTDKEKGDLIEFHTINQVGDREGSNKRLQKDIEKISEGDMLIGYHSVREIKGIWTLLEVKERLRGENIIRMEIKEKLTEPIEKNEVEGIVEEKLDLRGKTIIGLSPEIYDGIKRVLYERIENEDELVKVPKIDFDREVEIGDTLHFPASDRERLREQIEINLKKGKHIILTGPPGTGKSKLAKIIAENYVEDNYTMVTATSDWSTFDTIGGYRPGQEGRLSFDSGVFLSCFKADGGKPENRWLVLDEINRADIDKAFGPLFSALTGDEITLSFKTDEDKNIKIEPQEAREKVHPSQDIYVVPGDWRLIATMNTYDKTSLYEMSYAFMRRFAFIPVTIPENENIDENLVRNYLDCWDIENYEYKLQVAELWKIINKVRKIGPAIVEDLYSYLVEDENFTSPIINFVLPQFEGARKKHILDFIDDLENLAGEKGVISEDNLDTDRIRNFADDYFRLEGEAIGS